MDTEKLARLALDVSSTDLVTSRDAVRDLKATLCPTSLLAAWSSEEQRPSLERLLRAAEEVGNPDVYAVVASCLEAALSTEDVGARLLAADAARVIPQFLLGAMGGCGGVELAYRARPAVLALMRLTVEAKEEEVSGAAEVGRLIDTLLDAEKSLRLFDCDAVESEDNALVYTYLRRFSTRLTEITKETVVAFDTDPLLLANYLVVSGIIGQREAPPEALVRRVEAVLDAHDDDLYVAFVSRYCSILLFHKEDNAAAHAERWVSAALSLALLDGCGEDALDSVFDLVGSASTTCGGWKAVVAHLPADWLDARLRSRSVPSQRTVLCFLNSLLLSPYFDPRAVALLPLLRDAWQLRSSLDDTVRLATWELARAVMGNAVLREQFAASYAAFLCGAVHEENVAIRALQHKLAVILSTCGVSLPDSTKQALETFHKRGLYPPGCAGVAEMTKD